MRAIPSRWAVSPLFLLVATALIPTPPVNAACDQLTYDDLVINTQYTAGTSFVTGGTTVNVREFFLTIGPCAPPSISNFARVMSSGACFTGNGIFLLNVNLDFVFGGTVTDVVIPYLELGGVKNLGINGDCRVRPNYAGYDGTTLGGVTIEVVHNGQPGQGCGVIVLTGDVQELRLGGQEVVHDKLTFCRACEEPKTSARAGFDDLPLGGNYTVGTGFTSGQADFAIRPFFSPPGPGCAVPFGNGFATVVASDFACAPGQELLVNNVNVAIDFGTSDHGHRDLVRRARRQREPGDQRRLPEPQQLRRRERCRGRGCRGARDRFRRARTGMRSPLCERADRRVHARRPGALDRSGARLPARGAGGG